MPRGDGQKSTTAEIELKFALSTVRKIVEISKENKGFGGPRKQRIMRVRKFWD